LLRPQAVPSNPWIPLPHCTRYAKSLPKFYQETAQRSLSQPGRAPAPPLRRCYQFALVCALALLCQCGKPPKPIVVGSQNGSAQMVVGEIVAQLLEHSLGAGPKVERRLGTGAEQILYQSLLGGEISVYPSFTGAIETVILREQPASDPSQVWERSHGEMNRTAKMELFKPLGYENPPTMVIRTADAEGGKLTTLSQAAEGKTPWKIGVSYEFQQHLDSIPAISSYKLPMAQALRGVEARQLFPSLEKGDLTMIAADATDGRLTSPDFRTLADDKHAFPPYQACLLARQDILAAEPQLRSILNELSGKFTTEGVRKMGAEVDLNHRQLTDVAAEFLAQAGLK
jgi:glycine betaine/choline ABC-type transport system substrate-binding protein